MSQQIHKRKGIRRLVSALGHQRAGVEHALAHDPAIRQVGIAVIVLIVISALLPIGAVEHLLLAITTVQVLVMEVVNSAIEATVDRISEKRHPLAKQAKDLGSVAVALAVMLAGACWVVIAGPLVLGLLRPGA